MQNTLIYARVSSKDQEREGFSIPAQLRSNREYAAKNNLQILREFVDVETAKTSGRKQFGEMVQFLKNDPTCRTIVVDKTDRLYRNFKDCVILEDLEVEIHLVKEGQTISKDSKSQAKLFHGLQVVMARNYIDNLRDEVLKGMREKAEQGIYPSRPPLGYRNNKILHNIEINPATAPIAVRMFELYASGNSSLLTVRKTLGREFGRVCALGYIKRLLRNPFYIGKFVWQGKIYDGNHPALIAKSIFDRVQQVLDGKIRPRQRNMIFLSLACLHAPTIIVL
jgi:site-specific DNA recombinase